MKLARGQIAAIVFLFLLAVLAIMLLRREAVRLMEIESETIIIPADK
ncbi:MAG: hypothetical protein GF392_01110 [Candidatus Omnitrophica bacterium]|nr:hypothetical protein [Candidatus Omnitrophota bacterium]